jgi:hypothetical protein
MNLSLLVGGIPTPLKNMKVSWDDDIPNIWKINMFQTTNQAVFLHVYAIWAKHMQIHRFVWKLTKYLDELR